MQIQYNIQQSLKVNPPTYNLEEGIEFIERIHGHLPSLIKVDSSGNSLNPRFKEVDKYDHDGLTFHNKVLYDKELMVVEQRKDGELELISGFGRCFYFSERDIDTFMIDVVKFTSPHYKHLHKIRFNASPDHVSKGIPNTEATILKGLSDAKKANSFNHEDDKECMRDLRFTTNGSKSEEQLKKLLRKWRKTNSKDATVRPLTTPVANSLNKKMEFPSGGYVADASLTSYGRIGFCISRKDDIDIKMRTFIDLYDKWKVPIELYGFIQHVVPRNLAKQRYDMLKTWNESIEWMQKKLPDEYKDILLFKGFHAHLRTSNPADGGKPTERGIVDVNGKIIIDLDPPIS